MTSPAALVDAAKQALADGFEKTLNRLIAGDPDAPELLEVVDPQAKAPLLISGRRARARCDPLPR